MMEPWGPGSMGPKQEVAGEQETRGKLEEKPQAEQSEGFACVREPGQKSLF